MMIATMKRLAILLLGPLIMIPTLPIRIYAYDDYEWRRVDSQNPEVQRIIREVCVFPLEDNLMRNLRILFYTMGWRFRYDYTLEHAWQPIPEILRQKKGVCCDFARLYYSLLRGIGWPEHRIRIVCGPIYDLFDNYIGDWHAWVEIKSPSPTGTALALAANQSILGLEGEQLVMGFNDTMVTLPQITEERIRETQTLGWFTRDGWIPIDPTASVCTYGLFPFLADLYLTFGYGTFLLAGWRVHFDEIYIYDFYPSGPDRENPMWDELTISLEPNESFNVSYLHSVELYKIPTAINGSVSSTAPIDFEIRGPRMQSVDLASSVTDYPFRVELGWQLNPYVFPRDLGIYWFSVSNPQADAVDVTFGKISSIISILILTEQNFDQTLYDEYCRLGSPSIVSCDQAGNEKDTFQTTDDVYVKGSRYPASTEVGIYIIMDGYEATPSNAETVTYATTETDGSLATTLVWTSPLKLGKYDIWVDTNGNNQFDEGDTLNDQAIGVYAFFVVPELPYGTAASVFVMLLALIMYKRR